MTELEYSDFLKEETDLEREANLILEHHGVKGMHWGVRRTPEQLGHKKKGLTLSGFVSSVKKPAVKAKKVRAKKKAAKVKAQSKKQEESNEEIRKKLLDSTDPAFIYKHRQLLDNKELQDRIDRINKEQRIKELIPDPNAKKKKAMKSGEEFLKSAASMADSVGKIYDAYNKVTGGDKTGKGKKDKSDDKKKDKSKNSDLDATVKATQQFFSDPGIRAMLALGMVTPGDRKNINKQAKEENEKRKKTWSSNS